jgi:AcrR family transcriptional regulator
MRYISGTRAVNQAKGREAQKARTRTLIVAAAGGLTQPTVEQAADAAGVSRATAYRYFPTQEALSVELESGDVWREVEALVNDPQTADVGARLDRLIDAVVRTVYAEERHVRTALRVYHDIWLRDPDSPVRKGRRMDWIDKTISPVPAEARESLRLALALAISPDAVTMLKDVARLDAEQTRRVLKGAARAMLRAAEQLDGKSEEASPQAG